MALLRARPRALHGGPGVGSTTTLSSSSTSRLKRAVVGWMYLAAVLSLTCLVAADDARQRDRGGNHGNQNSNSNNHPAPSTAAPAGHVMLGEAMQNMTAYEGDTMRIFCEITGDPLPQYNWYRNGVPIATIEQQDSRYNAKPMTWGSRVRIQNVRLSDAGVYRCEGWNRWGRKDTEATLTVRAGPNPKKKSGGGRSSQEDADAPDFFDDDDDEIEYHPDYNPNLDDSVLAPVDPKLFPGVGDGHFDPFDTDTDQSEVADSNPFLNIYTGPKLTSNGECRQYNGAACSKLIANKSVYVTEQDQLTRMEGRMTDAVLLMANFRDLTEQCSKYAVPTLCYYAFPICDEMTHKPRQICKDECESLERSVCQHEFLMARQHNLMGQDFVLPNCAALPDVTSEEGRNCLRIGLIDPPARPKQQQPKQVSASTGSECYEGSGGDYSGSAHTTESGYECQKWTASTPHQHRYSPATFPQLGDHNYCRNPGNQRPAPWCYTTNSDVVTEACNIPKCVAEARKSSSQHLLLIVVPTLAVSGALIVLLLIVCLCKKNKQNAKPSLSNGPAQQPVEMSALLSNQQKVRAREFPPTALRLTKALGDCACGRVYRGDLCGYYSDNTIINVVVKALQEDAVMGVKPQDFYRELDVLTDIKHPNILSLLGVKLQDKPACMIFEQHSDINLQEYLVQHSPQSEMYENEGHILNYNELLHVVTQVASGMEYLTSHKYIHRDLAARNVFVSKNLTAKISNLGLLQEAYLSDYYRVPNCNAQLPVRWMPIEAILYGKVGTESDVWSYGIVLWEVFSFGLQPYYGYNDQEVIDMIQARQILPCPDACPSAVYGLMIECWNESAVCRPSFKDIHTRLIHWKADAIINQTAMNNVVNYGPISGPPSQSNSGSHRSMKSPSHHSSTGPSNNTASTGLTSHSQQQPLQQQQVPQHFFANMHGHPTTNGHIQNAYRQAPYMQTAVNPYYSAATAPEHARIYSNGHVSAQSPAYAALPSPAGSVASHPSSSLLSSAPSSGASNTRQYGFPTVVSTPYSQTPDFTKSPRLDSNSSKPYSNDSGMYIPDLRDNEYH